MEDITPGQKNVLMPRVKLFTGSGVKYKNKDTVFARITPCLEHDKIIQASNLNDGKGFGSTEYFVFRNKEGRTDAEYIYYLAVSDLIKQPAIKSMIGASGRQRAQRDVIA